MKKMMIAGLTVCIFLGVLFGLMYLNGPTSEELVASVDWGTLCVYGDNTEENTRIEVQMINGENSLILPATVTPETVSLFFDMPRSVKVYITGDLKSTLLRSGVKVDLTTLCSGGNYDLKLMARKGRAVSEYSLKIYFADQIGAMYLLSDDPENKGRAWVESSPDKSNRATGSMVLQSADGAIVYQDALTQIKGRGNSTWAVDKKPYQIKLSEKTDLLQTGNEDNETKTWVLLANYLDPSAMHNTLIYNLGRELGMEFCTENKWVNLYYDGEYRGCYLLSEKVEINSGRVDITDLEELNEEANDGVDIEELPVETGTTANGATYTYCVGMNSPEDITGGYLLELEYDTRVEEEICHFRTVRGQNVVVKSPEYASMEEMDYIASLYQEWEDAVYNGGINPATGKHHTEYVDLRSSAICYLANEFSKNLDGFTSSAYFYKDQNEDVMNMGPLWDYDLTMNHDGADSPTGFYTGRVGLGAALCELGDFREAVKKVYLEEMYPVLTSVVLGGEDAVSPNGEIRSISYYDDLLSDAMVCNNLLWSETNEWKRDMTRLTDFAAERAEYLKAVYSAWSADKEFVFPDHMYADVDQNDWYYEDVNKAAEYGLMLGVGMDEFAPEARVLRVQIIQSMYNMAGKPLVDYIEAFEDVKRNDWYADAVSWGVQNGVLDESPDGMFAPKGHMLREEGIVYLYRYLDSPEVDVSCLNGFEEAHEISESARNAVAWAVETDILVIQNGELRPLDAVTRAEWASILVRFYEKYKII